MRFNIKTNPKDESDIYDGVRQRQLTNAEILELLNRGREAEDALSSIATVVRVKLQEIFRE